METKICSRCKRELPLDMFSIRDKSKGTYRADCKECHSDYMKQRNIEKREIVNDIKDNEVCRKCGEDRNWVLDFHHIDPSEKENTVSRMVSNTYSIDKTLDEIKKCVTLCSNCHRDFHYMEQKYGIDIYEYLYGDIILEDFDI